MNDINAFMKLALENLELATEWRSKLVPLSSDHLEYGRCIWQSRRYALAAIVFSAMTTEAYINDYAVRNLSHTFFKAYLERMDHLQKWVIIPQLVTGKEYPRGRQGYEGIKELVEYRNNIVHSKTKKIDPEPSKVETFVTDHVYKVIDYASRAVKVPALAVKDLVEIDPKEAAYLKGLDGASS